MTNGKPAWISSAAQADSSPWLEAWTSPRSNDSPTRDFRRISSECEAPPAALETASDRSRRLSSLGSRRRRHASDLPIRESGSPCSDPLLPDDFDQYPLRPSPVELAVEDLLPGSEVQLAFRD